MKTKVELTQAINNLKRQNVDGIYDERINLYTEQLNNHPKSATREIRVVHSEGEERAIIEFNKDKRFTITE